MYGESDITRVVGVRGSIEGFTKDNNASRGAQDKKGMASVADSQQSGNMQGEMIEDVVTSVEVVHGHDRPHARTPSRAAGMCNY